MIYVIDTETTGQQEVPEIIELAWRRIELDPLEPQESFNQLYRPELKITPAAMATHHIIPEDLKDAPGSIEAKLPTDATHIVGHNIDYDWIALGRPNVKRICTLAMARTVWAHEEGHSLGACIYRCMLFAEARTALKQAHRALVDVDLCVFLLSRFIENAEEDLSTGQQLWEYSERCRVPTVWSFGKYRGRPVAGTDPGYLSWVLKQPDMDPYVKKAARLALGG